MVPWSQAAIDCDDDNGDLTRINRSMRRLIQRSWQRRRGIGGSFPDPPVGAALAALSWSPSPTPPRRAAREPRLLADVRAYDEAKRHPSDQVSFEQAMAEIEADAETRFQLRAQRGAGNEARGLELLEKAVSVERQRRAC
jgi:hypothetical protein